MCLLLFQRDPAEGPEPRHQCDGRDQSEGHEVGALRGIRRQAVGKACCGLPCLAQKFEPGADGRCGVDGRGLDLIRHDPCREGTEVIDIVGGLMWVLMRFKQPVGLEHDGHHPPKTRRAKTDGAFKHRVVHDIALATLDEVQRPFDGGALAAVGIGDTGKLRRNVLIFQPDNPGVRGFGIAMGDLEVRGEGEGLDAGVPVPKLLDQKFDLFVFEGFAGQQNILDVLCHQNGFLELVLHLIADFMQRLSRILTDAGDMLFVIQFYNRIADASDAAQHDEIDDDIRLGCCVVPKRVCHAFFLCLPAHLTSLGHLRVSYFPADRYFCGQSWRNSDQNGLFVGDPR